MPTLEMPPAQLACIRCGYDLRGLSLDADCPECGLAVHRSAAAASGTGLADAPPPWVGTVAAGAIVAAAAYLAPFGMAALNAYNLLDRVWWARLVVLLLILLIHAVAAFLITVPEPGPRRRGRVPDRVAAWALRLGSLGPMAALCLILYVTFRGRWGDYSPWILLLQAAMIPCPALMMLRLQRLARRVGRPRVAEHAAIAGCALSVAAAALAVMGASFSRNQGVMWMAGVTIAAVVFYLWATWTLLMIARSLRAAAREARAAWRDADASEPARVTTTS